jgi:LuxR family maltose regulon positive regulatory protein
MSPYSWLIRAKVDRPQEQVIHIEREQILERLEADGGRRATFAIAPAGFGKTTLLAQWCHRRLRMGDKVAWLNIDEGDRDPHQFLIYLIFALGSAGVPMADLEHQAGQGLQDVSVRAVLARLLELITTEPTQVHLILDDYHRAQCEEVDRVTRDLLACSPPNLHVTISSRVRPALELPRLIAAGQGAELTAAMLRFSREETRAAFATELSEEMLDALLERTEGWAIAIQLARLLLAGRADEPDRIRRLTGDHGHIANYLAEQVVAGLSEDLQEFLMRTSILERFNAELANAICGRQDAWDMLWRLDHLNALLIPMDAQHRWFRFHHLFAECLQNLLARKHPELLRELHSRASLWFEGQGRVSEAVRHASLAGDVSRSARLTEAAGGWELILFGGIAYLRNLLGAVPERELAKYPRLQMAKAYLHLKDGKIVAARAVFNAATAASRADTVSAAFRRDALNVGTLISGYEDNWLTPQNYDELASITDSLAPEDRVTHGVIYCERAMAAMALGRFEEAHSVSEQAMREMRHGGTVLGLNYCYLHAGLAAFYQGRTHLADQTLREARRMAEENFGADSGLRNAADLLLATVHYWCNTFNEDERRNFHKALSYIEENDGWFELYAGGLEVEAGLAMESGDLHSLRTAVDRADRIAAARGIRRLADLAAGYRLRLFDLEGKATKAEALAQEIETRYRLGCWRSEPHRWRPYYQVALSLAHHHLERNRQAAVAFTDDLIACLRGIQAPPYLFAALTVKADLERRLGRRTDALAALKDGLDLGIAAQIRRPLLLYPSTAAMLASDAQGDSTRRTLIQGSLDKKVLWRQGERGAIEVTFTPREWEIIGELMHGMSNKEIGRALDLSENTVKFHLKSIFSKLEVRERGTAIKRVRDLHPLT